MTPRRPRRSIAAVAFATLFAILVPGLAFAHAELDTVTPADKSTVVGTPPEIKMTFTEALDPGKSSIRMVDASGSVIDAQSSVPSGGDAKTMILAVNGDLQPGTYTLRWTSASAEDGDLDHGTTTFTVTAPPPSASPSAAPTASAASSAEPSAVASVAPSPSVAAAPSPSAAPTTPATSTTDALIPIVVVLAILAGLGIWFLRGRGRQAS